MVGIKFENTSMENPMIKIIGNTPILCKAIFSLFSSIILPITGRNIATDTIPAPPKRDSPRAPLFGIYSAMKPNIVGQK